MSIIDAQRRPSGLLARNNLPITNSRYGITGMAIGPDGRTLVVGVPKVGASSGVVSASDANRGDILVFDLDTLNLMTGAIAAPVVATLPSDGIGGKGTQIITATNNPNHFLISNVKDFDRGLSTLVINRDGSGRILSAEMNDIRMFQSGDQIQRDRLDIQRAQSAVLVTVGDVEYAIVSDDNNNFDDPYWNAMFEAPTFIPNPFGPPLAVGGSASAKKVNVGGKLGIVKDPFGTAQYLGATLPLDGYGIRNLSLSDDGKVLLGQLYGKYGTLDSLNQQPHQSQAWDVLKLIEQAELNAADGLTKHIVLPVGTEQIIPTQTGAPAGTFFDDPAPQVTVTGNMGDVIGVNLKDLIFKQLGFNQNELSDFEIDTMSRFAYAPTQVTSLAMPSMALVTTTDTTNTPTNDQIYSRLEIFGGTALFKNTGLFYMVPNLNSEDMNTLRTGGTVGDKEATLTVRFTYQGEIHTVTVTVTAKDAAHGVFFGDRPLDDPGYSAFTLKGTVGASGADNDRLDTYRVEQRLKYLGYSAFGYKAGAATDNPSTLRDFAVDGQFSAWEESALRAFYADTHLRNTSDDKNWGINKVSTKLTVGPAADTLDWLNAYNAPHWMNIYASFGIPTNRLNQSTADFKDGTDKKFEIYGTSWERDLLEAWTLQQDKLGSIGAARLQLNGLTDPGYAFATHATGNHSIGMGIDLGVGQWIIRDNQKKQDPVGPNGNNPNIGIIPVNGWSVANAITASALLPSSMGAGNSALDNQAQALRDFLSLYALTQQDAVGNNGTWEELLAGADNDVKRNALFGDGTKSGGLIEEVLIGDKKKKPTDTLRNPYDNINAVLDALNIKAEPSHDHQNHFHIVLRTPQRQVILPTHNLLADAATSDQAPPTDSQPTLLGAAQILLNQLQPHLELNPDEEVTMFVADLPPDVPAQYAPIIVAQVKPAQSGATNINRTVGVCQLVENQEGSRLSAVNGFEPIRALNIYFSWVEHREVGLQGTVTLLQTPTHGTVEGDSNGAYLYIPSDLAYQGPDKATFLVEIGGIKAKVVYYFQVLPGVGGGTEGSDPYDDKKLCPKGEYWKISLSDTDAVSSLAGFISPTSPLNYQLKNVDVSLNFANLVNGAVGETVGHTITLDDDGAGHGWFIDSTPQSNDEFLATSNPNEWIAKPGSEAAGKMDLLTVLLHEYGHALGLDHSADTHDFMAEELQPGVRRTVSDADMALLWSLLSEPVLADGSIDASTGAVTGMGDGSDPSAPFAPLSSLGMSFFFGFARRRVTASDAQGIVLPPITGGDPNAITVTPQVTVNSTPQQELATHTGIYNGNFAQADSTASQYGWSTRGNVSMSSGAAVALQRVPPTEVKNGCCTMAPA